MTNRVLLGDLGGTDYGLKVSLPDIELESNITLTAPDRIVAASGTPFSSLVAGDYVRLEGTSSDEQYEVANILSSGAQIETVEQTISTESSGASKKCFQVYPVELVDSSSDFLFDSTEAELGNSLKSGTISLTCDSSTAVQTSSKVYWKSDQSSIGYIPAVIFSRRSGSSIYQSTSRAYWADLYLDTLRFGDATQAYARVTDSWMEIETTRYVKGGGVLLGGVGLPAGTYSFSYYALAIGNISITSVGP